MFSSCDNLPQRTPSRSLSWWMLLIVAIFGAGVYLNTLKNDFAFDDLGVIVHNDHVVYLDWVGIWHDNYWPKIEGVLPDSLYRPLTVWSYLANQAISPNNPLPFHLVNVLLHALVSVLVCAFAWRVLGDRWIALVAGILFAVHPLHTEAVSNTVGRAELLAALWAMLALLVYLPSKPLREELSAPRRPFWHGILVAVCFFTAMLSKETPASIAVGIVLIDAWRWARWNKDQRPRFFAWFGSQALRYYLPIAAAFGIYLVMRIHACGLMTANGLIHRIVNPLIDATVPERIVTPFLLLAKYLWLTMWPLHLSADYSAPSLMPTADVFAPLAALGILTCVLTLLMGVRHWKKSPELLLLIGLFGTSYMLVANVIRIGTIFGERLFYWPSAFVIILAAWALIRAAQFLIEHRQRVLACGAGIVCFAAVVGMCRITWVRNTDWSNNIALAIATGRDNPASGKACSWAGSTLEVSGVPAFEAYGLSLTYRAIELTPDFVSPRWDLAKYYGYRNQFGKSVTALAEAVRLDPGTHNTCVAIPAVLDELRSKNPKDYMPELEAYQKDNPSHEAAYFALGLAYHAQKNYELAEQNIRKALDLGNHSVRNNFDQFHEAAAELAAVKFERKDYDRAIEMMRKYTFFMRNSTDAHCEFASMLLQLDPKKYPHAVQEAALNVALASELDANAPRVRDLKATISRRHAVDVPQFADAAASSAFVGRPSLALPNAGGTHR